MPVHRLADHHGLSGSGGRADYRECHHGLDRLRLDNIVRLFVDARESSVAKRDRSGDSRRRFEHRRCANRYGNRSGTVDTNRAGCRAVASARTDADADANSDANANANAQPESFADSDTHADSGSDTDA